ncbi:MAG: hypothetical protein ACOZNI_23315 [Myxococcota bacterium]
MVPLLVLTGCLEEVTGEDVPLDPRFYEQQGQEGGVARDPNAGGTGDGAYVGYTGETWHVEGVVEAKDALPVQIDVNEFDPSQPAGTKRAGAIHLVEPGTFELEVPATLKKLQLQAFQDPDVNGPNETDPFAQVTVDLSGGSPTEPVKLTLAVGGRGGPTSTPPSGSPAPPGAPTPSASPPPPPQLNLPPGPKVKVSGTVDAARADLPIMLDFFTAGASGGKRNFLGKHSVAKPGEWSVELTAGMGKVEIEAYQDLTANSYTPDDPIARLGSPVDVGTEDVTGLKLVVPAAR